MPSFYINGTVHGTWCTVVEAANAEEAREIMQKEIEREDFYIDIEDVEDCTINGTTKLNDRIAE